MRRLCLFVFATALAAGPVCAQPAPIAAAKKHVPLHRAPSATAPIDKGPFTADANRAYQGGGVILQGAPGAPAPMPAPTPPGQAPRNMVPP